MNSFSKPIGSRIEEYPSRILASLSENAKSELAIQLVRTKNYAALKHVVDHIDHCWYEPLTVALERLDIDAIRIITKSSNFQRVYISQLIENFYQWPEAEFCQFYKGDVRTKKDEIFKMLVSAKDKPDIKDLQLLARKVSKDEFDLIISRKSIDLHSPEYKGLNLSYHQFSSPILRVNSQSNPSITEAILTRTYSTSPSIGEEKLRSIFSKLIKMDSVAKDMLTYLALQISKGDDVKIFIHDKAGAHYDSFANVVLISSSHIYDSEFTFESALIHEIGHYFYNKMYQNNSKPFHGAETIADNIAKYFKLNLKELDDEFGTDTPTYNIVTDLFSKINATFANKNNTEFSDSVTLLTDISNKFQSASRKPVYKAANLLGFDTKDMDKYKFIEEYTELFMHKSLILLFTLNSAVPYQHTLQSDALFSENMKILLDIYLEYANESTCEYFANEFAKEELTSDYVLSWAIESFLPEVVKDLGLTPNQIHFLGRIGDYISRDGHLYSDSMEDRRTEEKQAELIVRYAELKAAGMDQDILDSFDELVSFHNENASLQVRHELEQYIQMWQDGL